MTYQSDLIACYDSQAEHFHHTRWNHKRPELEHIKPLLRSQPKGSSFLDLGCGSGRISERLETSWVDFLYAWVDLSSGMIDVAKKTYPESKFFCAWMTEYLQSVPQQSQDIIFCLAAFHHLESQESRIKALHTLYRALEYGGVVILINWSRSWWFVQKYKQACIKAAWKSLLSLWYYKRNDILVPRKDPQYSSNKKIFHRYYHMFTLTELKKLCSFTDFTLDTLWYIDQEWQLTQDRKNSRNSLCILKK